MLWLQLKCIAFIFGFWVEENSIMFSLSCLLISLVSMKLFVHPCSLIYPRGLHRIAGFVQYMFLLLYIMLYYIPPSHKILIQYIIIWSNNVRNCENLPAVRKCFHVTIISAVIAFGCFSSYDEVSSPYTGFPS